ncbi:MULTISPECIES: thioredoxin family protein [Enterococcus]|uniref:thioredoxin family protein n=1 Tax=Enterococcus TaxID=1350 RepID=UPI000B691F62|nr:MULTISPECIES: thioredoxin family protein [Enterococcus]MBO1354515.1 thioredoxin family protein [Enterococcus sp. DIV0212c]OTP50527.1 hypothetical protein A5881_001951 [Enterococcus termitis]
MIIIVAGVLFMMNNQTKDYTKNKIDMEELEQFKTAKKDVFVVVGNRGCSSCQEYKPVMEEAIENTNKTVYYMDTDNAKNSGFLKEHNITVTPTILIVENGNMKRLEGSRELKETEDILLGKAKF